MVTTSTTEAKVSQPKQQAQTDVTNELPQMGDSQNSETILAGLGLLSASLLGLFGLGKKKRKEDK